MPVECEIYKDTAGGYRWRLVDAGNHRIVGDSAEAYTRKADAVRAATNVVADVQHGVELVDVEPD